MKKILFTTFLSAVIFTAKAQTFSTADTLQQYTGKYKFPDGSMFTEATVTLTDSTLTMSTALGSAQLQKRQGEEFEIMGYNGTATFKRNADGKISGVIILVGDLNLEGVKTDGLNISEVETSFGLKSFDWDHS